MSDRIPISVTVAKASKRMQRRHAKLFVTAQLAVHEALGKCLKNPAAWRVRKIVSTCQTLISFPHIAEMPSYWSEVHITPGCFPTDGEALSGVRYVPVVKALVLETPENANIGGVTIDPYKKLMLVDYIDGRRKDIRRTAAILARGNAYGFLFTEVQNKYLNEIMLAAKAMDAADAYPFLTLKGKTYDLREPD